MAPSGGTPIAVVARALLPGTRRLALEPSPGMTLEGGRQAVVRAHEQARRGDMRPVVDAGAVDRRVSCVAAPLRLSPRDVAVVWVMLPGASVPTSAVAATRRSAGRIASRLAGPDSASAHR
jgi:IclR family transcriptional regulator, acetate operon repressor